MIERNSINVTAYELISASDPEVLKSVSDNVESALKLGEGMPGSKIETREVIVQTISWDIYHLGRILKLPFPEVSLNKEWGIAPISNMRYSVPVSVDLNSEHPNGVIYYEPEFLKTKANEREGIDPVHKFDNLTLHGATAFSYYAIWFMKNNPGVDFPETIKDYLEKYHSIPLVVQSEIFQRRYENILAKVLKDS